MPTPEPEKLASITSGDTLSKGLDQRTIEGLGRHRWELVPGNPCNLRLRDGLNPEPTDLERNMDGCPVSPEVAVAVVTGRPDFIGCLDDVVLWDGIRGLVDNSRITPTMKRVSFIERVFGFFGLPGNDYKDEPS